ncbi:creatininase family protein [Candidatus Aerophobetes bacterium]|uniref:Creatininase family protein n=1 Tax=Aerophobetes bacterium TaxID=2030807 RepID=A0A497E395_UNCAE|nr:MAG: creatininase family protein [Candidatus Aerophobetes bacterium]
MSEQKRKAGIWLTTENPAIIFEDTEVGRLKKKIWDASEEEIDSILAEYGVPAPSELGKPGSYIQTTVRQRLIENRRKNDIVIIPLGSTEKHGRHMNSGMDTLVVTQIAEAVRRYTAKQGRAVNLAWPPIAYGAHPYHHIGMAGTVIMPQDVVRETLIYVMLGLWNDGFRKQILINNHGQLWVLESALHEFMYRYQLPGIFQVLDWHRAVREFFGLTGKPDSMETDFIHADEAETSLALLMFPEGMVDMSLAQDTSTKGYLPDGHFDRSVEPLRRPHRWSEGEGHAPIELFAQPEGVVGKASLASARKAKRPVAAILKYLTLVIDQILEAFPPGKVPPVEEVTLRSSKEMEPYLKEPESTGWKPVYALPRIGL